MLRSVKKWFRLLITQTTKSQSATRLPLTFWNTIATTYKETHFVAFLVNIGVAKFETWGQDIDFKYCLFGLLREISFVKIHLLMSIIEVEICIHDQNNPFLQFISCCFLITYLMSYIIANSCRSKRFSLNEVNPTQIIEYGNGK